MAETKEQRPLIVLPYTSKIDRSGAVRISSHTALVTDAAGHLYSDCVVDTIFYPGENTFGVDLPATSELGRDRLVDMGVPVESIIVGKNLNDTEAQLRWAMEQGAENPLVLDLGFHAGRTEELMRQIGYRGETMDADPIVVWYHSVELAKIEEFIKTPQKMFGISRVELAETIIRTGTRFGTPGKIGIRMLRTAMGAQGATVTDHGYVGPAEKYLKIARAQGLTIH